MIRCAALYRHRDDVDCTPVALGLRFVFDVADHDSGVAPCLDLGFAQNDLSCLLRGHSGDAFKLGTLLFIQGVYGSLLGFCRLDSLCQCLFTLFERILLLVQGFFALLQSSFAALKFAPAFFFFTFLFCFQP